MNLARQPKRIKGCQIEAAFPPCMQHGIYYVEDEDKRPRVCKPHHAAVEQTAWPPCVLAPSVDLLAIDTRAKAHHVLENADADRVVVRVQRARARGRRLHQIHLDRVQRGRLHRPVDTNPDRPPCIHPNRPRCIRQNVPRRHIMFFFFSTTALEALSKVGRYHDMIMGHT